ncbi:MAG: 3-phosphoshikimate 1-carboxyvinyltransferase [Dissulfurispiraceae bacterium]
MVNQTPLLHGVVAAPPSKSYTLRAIMIGGLNGKVTIVNPLVSEDSLAAIDVWAKLGAKIDFKNSNRLFIKGVSGHPKPLGSTINVNESGTLLRFILPILALAKGDFIVTGEKTILERSNKTIVEALRNWDVEIEGQGIQHKLPIRIKGGGGLKGGVTEISGREGSQAVSSLLIAASLAAEDTTIILKDKLVSRPYVDITIDALSKAGIKIERYGYRRFTIKRNQPFKIAEDFIIPGDYSSAAFLIAAACLVPSDVTITNLFNDAQGDKRIINILNRMGAKIKRHGDGVKIKGPFELQGADIDGSDIPDIIPILTAVACFANGKTRIENIEHLTHKESNRIKAPAGQLGKLGAKIDTSENSVTIYNSVLKPGIVSSCSDHRIAMLLAVIGLRIGNVRITNTNCITKSYPSFLNDLLSLGADITTF